MCGGGGTRSISSRRHVRVCAVGLFLAAIGLSVVPATAASLNPARLQVSRVGADLTDLQVTWSAVPGIDHYTVTVFDGTTDHATVVPSGTTNFVYDGSGACTRYRVNVAAVKADGSSGRTGDYWVPALAPGAVGNLQWSGKGDEVPSTLSWSAPAIRSERPPSRYDVLVTAVSNGRPILATSTTGTSVAIPGLEPNRMYKARVQAINDFGTCSSPTLLLRGAKTTMTPPRKVVAMRDPSVPATIRVSWAAPEWTGSASVTGYEVAYSAGSGPLNWLLVPGEHTTSVELALNPGKDWDLQVRAVGGGKASSLTKPVRVLRVGATGTPEMDPAVTISHSGAKVVVDVNDPVGSSTKYPKLDVRVAPTVGSGFTDRHVVSNRARKVVFGDMPCGVYTVQVTGTGAAVSKEFGRSILNLCSSDFLIAKDWKLVGGRAEITGNTVLLNYGSRVLSLRPRTSQDMVFTSTVDFKQGNGWGVWTRSRWTGGFVNSGYTFQYDTGYDNKFIIRLWNEDRECGTPIAQTRFPAKMSAYGKHEIAVVVSGDSLYATVDGIRMFDVASLTAAITASKCVMPVPDGTQVALRTWTSDTLVTFTDTAVR